MGQKHTYVRTCGTVRTYVSENRVGWCGYDRPRRAYVRTYVRMHCGVDLGIGLRTVAANRAGLVRWHMCEARVNQTKIYQRGTTTAATAIALLYNHGATT